MSEPHKFLVADIGGTNTRIGLAGSHGLDEATLRRFKNEDHTGFTAVLERYMNEVQPTGLLGACAGAAGPVVDGSVKMTNLDWEISRQTLAQVTQAKTVDVVNDLQAQGLALGELAGSSITKVNAASALDGATCLVVGLGTGYNIVPVHRDGARLLTPSCEAGHATVPYLPELHSLFQNMGATLGRVTVEGCLAGQGLENLYEAHAGTRLHAGEVMQLLANGDSTAQVAMESYMTILAAVVGDLIITHLPLGGIFFTGGVSRAVTPYFEAYDFEARLRAHYLGAAGLSQDFPLALIQDDFAALKGCVRHLNQMIA